MPFTHPMEKLNNWNKMIYILVELHFFVFFNNFFALQLKS